MVMWRHGATLSCTSRIILLNALLVWTHNMVLSYSEIVGVYELVLTLNLQLDW